MTSISEETFEAVFPRPSFEKLIPLKPKYKATPFPVESIPEPYQSMVQATAEACQVDPAMPGVTMLSVFAAAAGGAAEIQVRPGWREPLNIFTATIAAPGERKSAVQAALTEPLVSAEEVLAEQSANRRLEQDTLKTIASQAAEQARKAAAKDPAKQAEAVSAAMAAEEIEVPPITRLIADDITPEAAGTLIAEQKRLAVVSAEGGVLDTLAGRYSNNIPNLDLFLKGHAGDRLRIDRKGRSPEYVKKPSLTVGLMIQPAVLDAIGRNRQFRGRGLLARFLYAEPRSLIGVRNPRAEPAPDGVHDSYAEALQKLALDLAGWVGDPAPLTLTEQAHNDVVEILSATEKELAPGGVLAEIQDWGSKYVGAVLRIAGLLHLAERGEAGIRTPVTEDTILAAVEIGAYFKVHAVKAFTTMTTDPVINDMAYVWERIEATGATELSEREVHRETRSRFPTIDTLRPVLVNLADRGYLAQLPEPEQKRPGRKPSPRFAVNPDA